MSKKLEMTLGQDMSCYAVVKIPADTDLSPDNLTRIANQTVEENEDLMFEEDLSTCCALRIVSVRDADGRNLVEDIVVEQSPLDAGQKLALFLKGNIEMDQLVASASEYGLIPPVEMETLIGRISLPNNELGRTFVVRKGATQAEKDLAFIHALCQIAEIEYVGVNDE